MARKHDFKKHPELKNSQMDELYFESPHKQITEDFEARVTKVTDGDTIRVTTSFRNFDFPIRLLEIAAPELKERGGIQSKKWLESLIGNEDIFIEIEPKNRVGKWGRLLGRVFFRGMDVGEESMNRGLSVSFETRKQDTGTIPKFSSEVGF